MNRSFFYYNYFYIDLKEFIIWATLKTQYFMVSPDFSGSSHEIEINNNKRFDYVQREVSMVFRGAYMIFLFSLINMWKF
jgi:hypothetical protein